MTAFLLIAAAMAVVALVLLTRPLWRAPAADAAEAPARSPTMVAALTGFVAVIAIVGYALVGAPAALDPSSRVARDDSAAAAQIDAMVQRLATRLKDKPDDVDGWAMLGRSYAVLGRHGEANAAFKRALALKPDDPALLADLADTMAAASGGNLEGEPSALLARALQRDPGNQKALSLAGFAAFNRHDYTTALRHWEKLAQIAPDGDFTRLIAGGIDEARRRLAAAGGASTAASTTAGAPRAANPAGPGNSVSGIVQLAPALAGKAAPDDTVFVFARAAQGSRAPLAILRKQVKDLPLQFALDDSMAMSPAAKLSGAGEVIVSARISKSGQAMPQPGDLQGHSGTVVPGASGLVVEISEIVKP